MMNIEIMILRYHLIVAMVFEPVSAYRHFDEDRLNEEQIRLSMRTPVWVALVDPTDVNVAPPVSGVHPPVVLMICKRHVGAWHDDLIEVLVRQEGEDMVVFHVEHLTSRWRDYWQRFKGV